MNLSKIHNVECLKHDFQAMQQKLRLSVRCLLTIVSKLIAKFRQLIEVDNLEATQIFSYSMCPGIEKLRLTNNVDDLTHRQARNPLSSSVAFFYCVLNPSFGLFIYVFYTLTDHVSKGLFNDDHTSRRTIRVLLLMKQAFNMRKLLLKIYAFIHAIPSSPLHRWS